MSACLVLMGVLLGCSGGGPGAVQEPADAWFAEEKLQHFTVSAAATTMGYGAVRLALDRDEARAAAAATAFALGIAKEVADLRRGGPFSLKDLVWDAAGVGLGLALIHGIP